MKEQILELFEQGYNKREIARQLNCHVNTVKKHTKGMNNYVCPYTLTKEQEEQIIIIKQNTFYIKKEDYVSGEKRHLKEIIHRLYDLGLSNRRIAKELECGEDTVRSIISYYKGDELAIIKIKIRNRINFFRKKCNKGQQIGKPFTYQDLVDKFGIETQCYITKKPINLHEVDSYEFDHIDPLGTNDIDNLGLCLPKINSMKSDLTVEQLEEYCKMILEVA